MQEKTENILSISERIVQFLDYLKVNRYKFSQQTGVSESVLLNLFKAKNKPSVEILEKILNKYPALNVNWLLTGTGKMLLYEDDEIPKPACEMCRQKDETIEVLKMLITTQNKTVDLQHSRIEDLETQLGQKKKAG